MKPGSTAATPPRSQYGTMKQPDAWIIEAACSITSPSPTSMLISTLVAIAAQLAWVCSTAFSLPVVPDVKMVMTMSSGSGLRAGGVSGLRLRELQQIVRIGGVADADQLQALHRLREFAGAIGQIGAVDQRCRRRRLPASAAARRIDSREFSGTRDSRDFTKPKSIGSV